MSKAYTAQQFLARALTQRGKPYVFGAEANPLDPDPKALDCSELTQWDDNGLGGHLVDGAQNQYLQCRAAGLAISVEQAINTPGALLFMGSLDGSARGIHHVAPSQGNGLTIEARGHAYGVNVFSAFRGFNYGALMPDCDYTGKVPPITSPAGTLQTGPVVLRQGSKGEAVRWGQQFLNIVTPYYKLGNLKPITVDGDYGPATTARVEEFEHADNKLREFLWEKAGSKGAKPALLLADGVMTGPTEERLGQAVKRALAA